MAPKHILLVEDNPDDILLTLRAFKKSGLNCRIDVVKDGARALDYLLARGDYADRDPDDAPAVVLLDLKLPKVSGLEVLRHIRNDPRTRRQPVVILTSSREERDRIEGYDLGVNSYVRKPVNFDQFLDAVQQLELYWLLINEAAPRPSGGPHG